MRFGVGAGFIALDQIVAIAPEELVGTTLTEDEIVVVAAVHQIRSAAGIDAVVAASAVQDVALVCFAITDLDVAPSYS